MILAAVACILTMMAWPGMAWPDKAERARARQAEAHVQPDGGLWVSLIVVGLIIGLALYLGGAL